MRDDDRSSSSSTSRSSARPGQDAGGGLRVQALFLLTILVKTGASFLAWWLRMPWSLGFWLPLAAMAFYVVLGLKRRDRQVSDEKFADSCYYLGFIFTITSIVFSLLDLPSLSEHLPDIAVRFGAAMVSTVAGLVVRVYLVSFRPDAVDALEESEQAVLDASRRFREGLAMGVERLQGFESDVDRAARATVERVQLEVERLTLDHSRRLDGFFEAFERRQQAAAASAFAELQAAQARIAASLDVQSLAAQGHVASLQQAVEGFTTALEARLQASTFPDDYFARQLAAPLNQLRDAARDLSAQVLRTADEVGESSGVLSGTLKRLRGRAESAEASLAPVAALVAQQRALLASAQAQGAALERLVALLDERLAGRSSSAGDASPSSPSSPR